MNSLSNHRASRSRNYRSRSLNNLILGILLIFACLSLISGPAMAQSERKQDHDAIIQTREIALKALNTKDFSMLQPYLHPTFTITTVDNKIFNNLPAFEAYWKEQLSGPIEKIDLSLKVDALTTFLSENTGVAHGSANSTFQFKDGNVGIMPMRWTAVMQKFENKWTIQTLHFSSNLLDNPVLSASQQLGRLLAIGSGIGGLIVGGGLVWILRRQPRSQTVNYSSS